MPRYLLVIILIVCSSLPVGVWGQLQYTAEHYLTDNGLPSNAVQAAVTDTAGYIWMATRNGLCRYDGYSFYQHKAAGGNMVSMCANKAGMLVCYNNNSGLVVFNPYDNSVKVLAATRFKDSEPDNDHFNNLFTDDGGRIWCTDFTSAKYLNLPRGDTAFKSFTLARGNSSTDKLATFINPRKREVWVAAFNGLYTWQQKDDSLRAFADERLRHLNFTASAVVGNDSVMLAAEGKLFLVSVSTQKILAVYPTAWAGQRIIALGQTVINGRKIILASTPTDVFALESPSGATAIFTIRNSSSLINALHVAAATGQVWVSTTNGLYKLSLAGRYIHNYTLPGEGLAENHITCFVKAGNGDGIIMGGSAGRLYQLTNSGAVKAICNLGNTTINNLAYNGGALLLSTSTGLYAYNGTAANRITLPGSYNSAYIQKALVTGSHIWLLAKNLPVTVLDAGNYTPSKDLTVSANNIFAAGNIWNDIAEDNAEQVFMAGWIPKGFGLSLYNKDSGGFIPISGRTPSEETFIGDYYNRIALSKQFHLLFAGYGGFNTVNQHGTATNIISIQDHTLANEHAEGIEEMADGKIWFGTEEGIQVWNPVTDQVLLITTLNGLPYNNALFGFKKIDSSLLAVGFNKVISLINTGQLFNTGLVNKLVLSSVTVNGSPANVASNVIKVQPWQRNIVLSFSALCFSPPKQVIYRYRVNGGSWQSLGSNPVLTFANFKNGTYKIEVQVSDNLENWQERKLFFTVEAQAYFYETIWFSASILLLALGIAWLFFAYRLHQLKKVNTFRAALSQDLHDDVGATLSSINILSAMVEAQPDITGKTKNYLQIIINDVQLLQLKLDEIIWSLHKEPGSLVQLFTKLSSFAEHVLEAKNIHFNSHFNIKDTRQALSMEKKRNLYLLVKEALNNIAKHSQATEAWLLFTEEQGRIKIVVKDNGTGINNTKIAQRNGIKGMYKRAAAVKAALNIQTGPGTTVIELTIKL